MNNRVTHLYAFIADGESGFMSMRRAGQHFPMIVSGSSPVALQGLRETAAHIANASGRTIRLVKFSNPEELEAFVPGGMQ